MYLFIDFIYSEGPSLSLLEMYISGIGHGYHRRYHASMAYPWLQCFPISKRDCFSAAYQMARRFHFLCKA